MRNRDEWHQAFELMVSALVKDVGNKGIEDDTSAIPISSPPAVAVRLESLFEWVECAPTALCPIGSATPMRLDREQCSSLRHQVHSE